MEMNGKRSPSNLFQTSHDHSIFLNRIKNSIHNSSRMYFEMNISTNLELQTEPQRGTFYALGRSNVRTNMKLQTEPFYPFGH